MEDIVNLNPTPTEQLAQKLSSDPSIADTAIAPDIEKYDPLYRSIATYFVVDDNTDLNKFKGKLETIKEWAQKNASTEDRLDALWAIKSLEHRLGTPSLGEKRINHIYRWIRLDNERQRIIKEQELLERPV